MKIDIIHLLKLSKPSESINTALSEVFGDAGLSKCDSSIFAFLFDVIIERSEALVSELSMLSQSDLDRVWKVLHNVGSYSDLDFTYELTIKALNNTKGLL